MDFSKWNDLLVPGSRFYGFEVTGVHPVPEKDMVFYEFYHAKSGAKLSYVCCNDEEKVFSVVFRTTPENSTGVFHILEHSVLNGSEKYPVKDPFVQLIKTSLSTFINAMTSPDHTEYPVGAKNEKSFADLVRVYLDAVFHPILLRNPQILMQEGWHHEYDEETGKLSYHGVVYSEMQGAYNSPERIIGERSMKALYPDTCYAWSSGGDPVYIPDLTQEMFTSTYRRYYHPSNSHLFLYGEMDLMPRLEDIDKCLSDYDKIDPDTAIRGGAAKYSGAPCEGEYCVLADAPTEGRDYASMIWNISDSRTALDGMTVDLISELLMGSNAAPLSKAVLEKGLAEDIYPENDRSKFVNFGLVVKNTDGARFGELRETVYSVLRDIAENGFDPEDVEAALSDMEFAYRDNSGVYRGVMLLMSACTDVVHDLAPWDSAAFEKPLEELKALCACGGLQRFIKERILDNEYRAEVIMRPSRTLRAEMDRAREERLEAEKKAFGAEGLEEVKRRAAELLERQNTPDTPEAVATMPRLGIADLAKEPGICRSEERNIAGAPFIFHELPMGDVIFFNFYFEMPDYEKAALNGAGLLSELILRSGAAGMTAAEVQRKLRLLFGDIAFRPEAFAGEDGSRLMMVLSVKIMASKYAEAKAFLEKLFLTPDFTDEANSERLLNQYILRYKSNPPGTASRVRGYVHPAYAAKEEIDGTDFYRFVSSGVKPCHSELSALAARLFSKCMISVTASPEAMKTVEKEGLAFASAAVRRIENTVDYPVIPAGDEAFIYPATVQYTARYGKTSVPYSGAMNVAQMAARMDFLWNEVRAKGGAYGVGIDFERGNVFFSSYRDPNLGSTFKAFENTADFLNNFDTDEQGLVDVIVGAAGSFDGTTGYSLIAKAADRRYITGITDDMLRQEWTEMLNTTLEQFRKAGDAVREACAGGHITAAISEAKAASEGKLFAKVTNLYK